MKFAAVLALVAAATLVSAETNAQRLARGLSPNPPTKRAPGKRATPVSAARRGSASGTPSQCNTGSMQCCSSVENAGGSDDDDDDDNSVDSLLKLFGIEGVASGTPVGLNCSPITAVGSGSNSCTQQPVCCENNSYNGLINIGCSPININL